MIGGIVSYGRNVEQDDRFVSCDECINSSCTIGGLSPTKGNSTIIVMDDR